MTIAHFSYFKMTLILGFGFCFAVFPWLLLFTPLGLVIHDHYTGQAAAHSWFPWLLLVLSPFLLWAIAAAVRQVVVEQGRAVWVSEGRLWYPTPGGRLMRSLPLTDIAGVSKGRYGAYLFGWGVIDMQLNSGERMDQLASYFLAEPRSVVMDRINEALAATR